MKWYLLLIMHFLFAINAYTQNVGIGTTTPTAKLHVKGGLYLEGASGVTPVSGPGNRLMWIPLKAAFRSGGVSGTQWDDANIGNYSTAIGYNSWASSDYSTSLGNGTTASGLYAIAMGSNSLASGEGSVAFGNSTSALGGYSFASGGFTGAIGAYSTAMGAYSISSGQFSSAFGYYTKSKSYGGVVIGTFNDSTNAANPLEFDSGNRLFQIGNGMSDDARNNAMTVLQSGDVGIGVINPLSRLHVKKGGLLVDGTVGNTPMDGAGTRLMWIPIKAAFRAGSVDGTQWDDANIGNYSTASGHGTTASGQYSVAMGLGSIASGLTSTAIGDGPIASGEQSIAFGAITTASGLASFAVGYNTVASGIISTAIGQYTLASGNSSTAMGHNSVASGFASTAMGGATKGIGDYSTSMGLLTKSKAFSGLVIGTWNDSTNVASATYIDPLNRLFQIGNGTADDARSNAMTVLQNGNVGIGALNPVSRFHVNNGTILADGTIGATPVSGAGTRMMWIPALAAFRAGEVTGTQWDNSNIGLWSMALGYNSKANGNYSTALGYGSVASSPYSTALGFNALASNDYAISIGTNTIASGVNSVSLGEGTIANNSSTAIGSQTFASGYKSISMGAFTQATGLISTAMGHTTVASGAYSTTMGIQTVAIGSSSIAMGNNTAASGISSVSMGNNTTASGDYSTAMGNNTVASGISSVSIGTSTTASGNYSIATGSSTTAYGHYSFATGANTLANENYSVAMGTNTIASGVGSFTMGFLSRASGLNSTAIGDDARAKGSNSTALGSSTMSKSFCGFVVGVYNDTTNAANPLSSNPANRLFQIGNGTNNFLRSNAMTVLQNGNVGLGTTTPGYQLEITVDAAKPGGGSWSNSSDVRLKKDIHPYCDGLESVLKINPVIYKYNERSGYDTRPEYIGVIAQQLKEVAPYMVSTSKRKTDDGVDDYLQVDNSAMTYMLINAVKEQQQQINDQQLINESFQKQMTQQQDQIELLEKQVSILLEKIRQK